MDSQRFRRLRRIFEAARAKSAETRASFLKEECKDDYTLLVEVEKLLNADGVTDSFLDGSLHLKDDGPDPANLSALKPGTLLCNRYRIVKIIGHGGMGAVYEALDSELTQEGSKESIAVKLILAEYAGRKDLVRRFREEILLARHVTHRNVVRIFSLEKDGNLLFITMEFVNGQDLATLLDTHGCYSRREATEIMYQVVAGIQAAHEANVIHRDLKTRNVMLQPDGRVVVTDFGLARPLDNPLRTVTAGVVGTMAYMAPEQLRGEPSDQRADLYSLGVVFHELLTGKLPSLTEVQEEKRRATLSGILRQGADAGLSEKTNRELSRIVSRCLEQDPNNRYQSAKELRDDIEKWLHPPQTKSRLNRWLPVGAAAALAAMISCLLIWSILRPPASPPAEHATITILIADFSNRTGDPVFSDGTLESVLSIALEGSPFIASYSRGAAHKEARQLDHSDDLTEARAREIALRDGIQSVVWGSLARQGAQYILDVRVADADGEPHISRHATARTREEVLSTIGALARDLRRSLGERSPAPQRSETFTSGSLAAVHAYAVAQELALEGKGNEAIPEYRHAILLDPSLGRAYSGLAVIYGNKHQTDQALKYFAEALQHFARMTDREKYRTRGAYQLTSGSPDRAIDEYTQLVKEYPADNAGWANLALAWAFKRDMAKAIEYGRKAVSIYPKNVSQRSNLAWYLMFHGQYEEAIAQAKQAIGYNRSYEKAHIVVALAQLAQGNVADAEKTYNDLREISADGASAATVGLADEALYGGRIEEANNLLESGAKADLQTENSSAAAVKLAMLAQSKLRMGKPDEALKAASQADAITSKPDGALFQLAQVFVKIKPKKAEEIASQMAKSVDPSRRSYALVLQGELSLEKQDTQGAIAEFEQALRLVDNWSARYDLGLAYLQAHNYPEADGQLEACIRRSGEATSLFIDDAPTYHYFPPVYYFHALAEEGFGGDSSKTWFEKFLAIKARSGPDPMIEDARRHVNKN